ncbi:MAG: cobalamin biosynthesis protein CobD [Deltaproteobacteria bacterium]|nr:cobalamin biosynthesis protein CobD [Deltaproteobacteria bacterium]
MEPAALLVLACVVDTLIGDPSWLPHPIRLIGKASEKGEQWLRQGSSSPGQDFFRGLSLVVGIVMATYVSAALLLQILGTLSWWLEQSAAVLLGSFCLARRSLKEHAAAVFSPLAAGDLQKARTMLARIVSRETADLPEAEVIRGTLESVAENSSDGVIAPLLYLALGGVPLALAYKAVNTLDSMLGYHTERYEYFGKAAARLDDLVNLVPARLTAVALAGAAWLLSGFGLEYDGDAAWRIAWRDGRKHASPNAGYPEAAVAGALGVRLGGPSRYFGAVIEKPTLGEARHVLSAAHIPRSLVLLDTASGLMLVVLVIAACGLRIAE